MATINGSDLGEPLVGTPQDDILEIKRSDDMIYGYAGNDTLIGGDGKDYLSGIPNGYITTGGSGNDYIQGGPGNDRLTGGPGNDTFVLYFSGRGIDTITDFTPRQDTIRLTSAGDGQFDLINTGAVDDFLLYDANTGVLDGIDGITDLTVSPSRGITIRDLGNLPPHLQYDNNTGALSFSHNQQLIAYVHQVT